jgi:hypothetical protein
VRELRADIGIDTDQVTYLAASWRNAPDGYPAPPLAEALADLVGELGRKRGASTGGRCRTAIG